MAIPSSARMILARRVASARWYLTASRESTVGPIVLNGRLAPSEAAVMYRPL